MTKKTDYVTRPILRKTLDEALQRFAETLWPKMLSTFALREDLEEVKERLVRLEAKFDAGFAELNAKFDGGFTNLDAYLKRTESWHDEQVILRASHRRLKDALVRKGVVSDSELVV